MKFQHSCEVIKICRLQIPWSENLSCLHTPGDSFNSEHSLFKNYYVYVFENIFFTCFYFVTK